MVCGFLYNKINNILVSLPCVTVQPRLSAPVINQTLEPTKVQGQSTKYEAIVRCARMQLNAVLLLFMQKMSTSARTCK